MNYLRVLIIFILIILSSCKSTSYFSSSNDLAENDCTVFMLDGTEKKGKLTIQFETGNSSNKTVLLNTSVTQIEKIAIDSIKYYKIGNDSFYPKVIDLESFEIPYKDNLYLPNVRNILFLKRLTKENARINLFELYQSKNRTADGIEHFTYFVSFKNQGRLTAMNIRSSVFFPNFSEKMGVIISDCQQLFIKVNEKKKGYSVGQISVDLKKLEVIKRIIEEYNDCK